MEPSQFLFLVLDYCRGSGKISNKIKYGTSPIDLSMHISFQSVADTRETTSYSSLSSSLLFCSVVIGRLQSVKKRHTDMSMNTKINKRCVFVSLQSGLS